MLDGFSRCRVPSGNKTDNWELRGWLGYLSLYTSWLTLKAQQQTHFDLLRDGLQSSESCNAAWHVQSLSLPTLVA
jgi:hypothetical protein